jgi:hypothetical protein
MNPLSNHQIGQATHREYEAKYGNRFMGDEPQRESVRPLARHKLALALSGLSVTAVIVTLTMLF